MWSLLSWNKQETADHRWILHIGRHRRPEERRTHVFDEELRKVLVVIQTFLQLTNEEPEMFGRQTLARVATVCLSLRGTGSSTHSLCQS